eukprot:TRINITY_DN18544_c0_g1_i1.p2 TRINITY_DN18544_c0_g1~~TRINITY_DN18544_c0_g1_i1.p2  ORF type:complete len:131 (-),score=11.20 TRINITY_DN18544_c0_g1_i1:216-608(-)
MCNQKDLKHAGTFDFIVSSGGVTSHGCGPDALVRLSTRDTIVHLASYQGVERIRHEFLLTNFFVQMWIQHLQTNGHVHPGSELDYIILKRKFGPHTCWLADEYTFERCCVSQDFRCFDETFTRELCCGDR